MKRFASRRYAAVLTLTLLVAANASANDSSAKLAPPDARALADSMRLVESVYKQDIANAVTPATKAALAATLIYVASGSKDRPADQFALYSKARDTAAQAGDARTAFVAIDKLCERFEVDPLSMTAEALARIARAVRKQFDTRPFFDRCNAAINDAVMQDKLDVATRVSESAVSAARQLGDAALLKLANARAAEVRSIRLDFDKQQLALAALRQNPADPEANLLVGRYRCFVKDDWKNGLPLLARSGDAALKSIVEKELTAATADPHAKVALADAWLDLAATTQGPAHIQMQRRALKWYDDAGVSLIGLSRIRAEKTRAALMADGIRSGGHRMTPEEVLEQFAFPNKTFRISGDTITGRAGDCDDQTTFIWLQHPIHIESFEFGFSIKARWYHIAAVDIDGKHYMFSRGHWANQNTGVFAPGQGERRIAGVVNSPSDWASVKVVVERNKMTFYYNGDAVASCDMITPMTKSSMVRFGFSSHVTQISVKDVYYVER